MLGGRLAAWIDCPPNAVPAAGQYVLAVDPEDGTAPLATPLYPAEIVPQGFLAAPVIPSSWAPGTALELSRPLGRGFSLPPTARNVILAALGETAARLMPLLHQALLQGAAVALFVDSQVPNLPSDVEVHPVGALPDSLSWADFVALDVPVASLPGLRQRLGLAPGVQMPCPAQALVLAPLPCGGLAECGVCAIPVGRGWKLVCKDGPVFDVNDLWTY